MSDTGQGRAGPATAMRIDNIPLSAGLSVLAIGTLLVGFGAAFPWAMGAYLAALVSLILYVQPKPVYDHATPAPWPWPLLRWVASLGSLYLFVHLWVWAPEELAFLHDLPWLGSAVTVMLLWIVPSIIQPMIFTQLRNLRASEGGPNDPGGRGE